MLTSSRRSSKALVAKSLRLAGAPMVGATPRFAAVVMAALLGAVVLYGVAFSPVAHEVAHDTRHAIGFPCH